MCLFTVSSRITKNTNLNQNLLENYNTPLLNQLHNTIFGEKQCTTNTSLASFHTDEQYGNMCIMAIAKTTKTGNTMIKVCCSFK